MRLVWVTATALLIGSTAVAMPQAAHRLESDGLSCSGDRKGWVNTRPGVYHLDGKRYYGSMEQGKYAREAPTDAYARGVRDAGCSCDA